MLRNPLECQEILKVGPALKILILKLSLPHFDGLGMKSRGLGVSRSRYLGVEEFLVRVQAYLGIPHY